MKGHEKNQNKFDKIIRKSNMFSNKKRGSKASFRCLKRLSRKARQNLIQSEADEIDGGNDIENPRNLFAFFPSEHDDAIGNETKTNSIRQRISKDDHQNRDEGREADFRLLPTKGFKVPGENHGAYDNQSGGRDTAISEELEERIDEHR